MKRTALLVIDVQRVYTSRDSDLYCKDAKSTVKQINSLIELFEAQGAPIIFVKHVHKIDGSDLGRMFDFTGESEPDFNFKQGSPEIEYDEILSVPNHAIEIVKNRYSAFQGTQLEQILQKNNIDTVVISGFMTNFCCDSTARDAHDRDFFVDFVVDATGTPGTEHLSQSKIRNLVSELLEAGYARVSSTKAYLRRAKSSK